MIVYTAQLWLWRKLKEQNIPLLDTTMRSGDSVFAPTKELVYSYKYHGLSKDAYRIQYVDMMRESYMHNHARWLEVARLDKVALGCYCPAGEFCHRLILLDMFERVCRYHDIPFSRAGEFTSS